MDFPPIAVFCDSVFIDNNLFDYVDDEVGLHTDLQELFGDSNETIVEMVQHQFDRLPTHSIVYYHPVLQKLTDEQSWILLEINKIVWV